MTTRAELLKLSTTAASATMKKSPQPILASLRLEGDGRELRALGTDLSVSVEARMPCSVRVQACLVDAATLVDRVKSLPDGDVRIAIDKTSLTLSGGSRKFKIGIASADDFPAYHANDTKGLEVTAEILERLIKQGACCMSSDTTRPHLSAAFIESSANETIVWSSDGHRGARAVAQTPLALPAGGVLVPMRVVEVLRHFLDGSPVTVAATEADIIVRRGDATLIAKLAAAAPMPFATVFASAEGKGGRRMEVERLRIFDAVRVIAGASDDNKMITVRPSAGSIRIVGTPKNGQESEDVLVAECDGDAVVSCNGAYLTECLAAADGERVRIKVGDDMDPIVILGETTKHIVMPVRPEYAGANP